jgi:ATP-dependent RNA helicase DOB1
MREVQFVIFDEIHYMRNAERGVVWEETIILLPDNVRYIFLSATIPNARQFAQWIVYLHKQPCHVVYTDTRPVPLQHYIYPEGGEGIHLIVDVKGEFREDNYQAAMATLRDGGGQKRRGKNDGKSEDSSIFKLIKMIMENNFQPVISFCFSKRECEENAMQLARLDFNDEQEKKLVEEVFENATDCLSEDDRELPQVKSIVNILKRGIGVHHGGLLPLLKETVEILFSEGLIKCLFATETFAMGVNMPARTVLFTDSQKFDGKEMRVLQSSEYIQMAGRAGRRGLDDKGICILMAGEKMPQNDGTKLMKGDSEPLNSAFHLTYNMVLNLLRVEEINPEYMLEKSFYQFQNRCSIPEFQNQVQNAEEAIDSIKVPEKHMSYFKIRQQLQVLTKKALEIIQKPEYILPYLKPGRLIFIENQDQVFGWGVVISFIKRQDKDGKDYVLVDTLILCDRKSIDNCRGMGVMPKPAKSNNTIEGEMVVVPVTLDCIKKLSSIVLLCPENLKPKEARNKMFDNISETKRRFAGRGPVHDDVLPLIDPVADMGITDKTLVVTLNQIEKFEDRLMDHELHDDANLEDIYKSCEGKAEAEQKLQDAKTKLKGAYQVIKLDELKCRKKILRRMGYATEQDVIELKGRVACEISTADELLLTELMFSNIFDDLDVPQICAFLSCFVCERAPKDDEAPTLQGKLKTLVKQLQDQAKKIARISNECKLDLDEEEYVEKFQIALMDVVHAWAKGCSFSQVTEMTSFFEGSIIRVIRRLEELLRDMANAAHTIGNPELEKKFLDGITSIKRDIVFAASLYL